MDEQERIARDHLKVERISQEEEMRKSHEGVQKERLAMGQFLSEREAEGLKLHGKNKEDLQTAGEASLLRGRSAMERISDKDKKHYLKMQALEGQVLEQDLRKNNEKSKKPVQLTESQRDFVMEYRQMVRSCRVFDNEVRETVEETLEKHEELLPGKTHTEKTELLARLLTAFLPQREFFFYPPSDEQKSLVKKFLAGFKSNPKKELLKMREGLSGERLHRDYRDASAAGKNFRLIYTEMRKREALSAVFPLMVSGPVQQNENRDISGIRDSVSSYKKLINALLTLNGVTPLKGVDTEFNRDYQVLKTIRNKKNREKVREGNTRCGISIREDIQIVDLSTRKEEEREKALDDFLNAYETLRASERTENDRLKKKLNERIASAGRAYDSKTMYAGKYTSMQNFLKGETGSHFAAQVEEVKMPLGEERNIRVHSKAYYAEVYLREELQNAVSDANYTRYRRDRMKRVSSGDGIPEGFYQRNMKKEERRLIFLEQRMDDIKELLLRMRDPAFSEKLRQGTDEKTKRLYSMYRHEALQEGEKRQREEAFNICKTQMETEIDDIRKDFLRFKKQADPEDSEMAKLSVAPMVLEKYVQDVAPAIRERNLWLAEYEMYQREIERAKEDWAREDRRNEAKDRYRKSCGLVRKELPDQKTRETRLMERVDRIQSGKLKGLNGEESREALEYGRSHETALAVAEREGEQIKNELVFGDALHYWEGLDTNSRKSQYMELMGYTKEKDPVTGIPEKSYSRFTEKDLTVLTDEEVKILLRHLDYDLYLRYQEVFGLKAEARQGHEEEAKAEEIFRKINRKLPDSFRRSNRIIPDVIRRDIESYHDDYEARRKNYVIRHYMEKIKADYEKQKIIVENNKAFLGWLSRWKGNRVAVSKAGEAGDAFLNAESFYDGYTQYRSLCDYIKDVSTQMTKETIDRFEEERQELDRFLTEQGKVFLKRGAETRKACEKGMDLASKLVAGKLIKRDEKGNRVLQSQEEQNKTDALIQGNLAAKQTRELLDEMNRDLSKVIFRTEYSILHGEELPTAFRTTETEKCQKWYEKEYLKSAGRLEKQLKAEEKRLEKVQEIQDLRMKIESGKYDVDGAYVELMPPELYQLRLLCDLAIKCREYLEEYDWDSISDQRSIKQKKTGDPALTGNLFRRKETAGAMKEMLTGLYQRFRPLYEKYGDGKAWKADEGELERFQKERDQKGHWNNTEITTRQRMQLKLQKGWLAFDQYVPLTEKFTLTSKSLNKKQKEELSQKETREREARGSRIRFLSNAMGNYYRGDETEEEERAFLPAEKEYLEKNREKLEKQRQRAEAEAKKKIEEETKRFLEKTAREQCRAFFDRFGSEEMQETRVEWERFEEGVKVLQNYLVDSLSEKDFQDLTGDGEKLSAEKWAKLKEQYKTSRGRQGLSAAGNLMERLKVSFQEFSYSMDAGELPDARAFRYSAETEGEVKLLSMQKSMEDFERLEQLYQKYESMDAENQVNLTLKYFDMDLEGRPIAEAAKRREKLLAPKDREGMRALQREVRSCDQNLAVLRDTEKEIAEREISASAESRFESLKKHMLYHAVLVKGKYIEILKESIERRCREFTERRRTGAPFTAKEMEEGASLANQLSNMYRMAEEQWDSLGLFYGTDEKEFEGLEEDSHRKFAAVRDMFREVRKKEHHPLAEGLRSQMEETLKEKRKDVEEKKNKLFDEYGRASTKDKETKVGEIRQLSGEVQSLVGAAVKWPSNLGDLTRFVYGTGEQEKEAGGTIAFGQEASLAQMLDELMDFHNQAFEELEEEKRLYAPVQAKAKAVSAMLALNRKKRLLKPEELLQNARDVKNMYQDFMKDETVLLYLEEGKEDRIEELKKLGREIDDYVSTTEVDVYVDKERQKYYEVYTASVMALSNPGVLTEEEMKTLQEYRKNYVAIQKSSNFKNLLKSQNPFVLTLQESMTDQIGRIDRRLKAEKIHEKLLLEAEGMREGTLKLLAPYEKLPEGESLPATALPVLAGEIEKYRTMIASPNAALLQEAGVTEVDGILTEMEEKLTGLMERYFPRKGVALMPEDR